MKSNAPAGADGGEDKQGAASLGTRLRALRSEKGFSIARLAKLAGVPSSTISKIENGILNPSLVHAINLASALDANLGFLVDRTRARQAEFAIVRAGERATMCYPEMALSLEDLNDGFVPGLLEARVGAIGEGARSGDEGMRHPGEELVHVLSGAIHYEIDGEGFLLGAGDTLHFKCDEPHRWESAHKGTTTVLWVFSGGLSF